MKVSLPNANLFLHTIIRALDQVYYSPPEMRTPW